MGLRYEMEWNGMEWNESTSLIRHRKGGPEAADPTKVPADAINGLQRQAVLDYRSSVRAKASVGGTSDGVLDIKPIVDDRASADQKATRDIKAAHTAR